MFGDILMWALTVFGLIPMLKVLFGPKKTFQEQLAEFSDDVDDCGDDCAGWDQFGPSHEGSEVSSDSLDWLDYNDPAIDRFLAAETEADAERLFQEISLDEPPRFSMLEDFWLPRNSTRSTSTGPS